MPFEQFLEQQSQGDVQPLPTAPQDDIEHVPELATHVSHDEQSASLVHATAPLTQKPVLGSHAQPSLQLASIMHGWGGSQASLTRLHIEPIGQSASLAHLVPETQTLSPISQTSLAGQSALLLQRMGVSHVVPPTQAWLQHSENSVQAVPFALHPPLLLLDVELLLLDAELLLLDAELPLLVLDAPPPLLAPRSCVTVPSQAAQRSASAIAGARRGDQDFVRSVSEAVAKKVTG